ncbi:MAG: SDR family oxidoreductase [Candidatus Eremiobacteraeota bacterium]|nr:SDR family oxidoreductase [Candidatus Eremiobacteraeota bacterium]
MSTAIVTGGASGIGRATCRILAHDGWRVVVADRDAAGAERVAGEFGGTGLGVDVADEASVVALFDRALAALGGTLDALATPAGIVDTTPFMDIDLATFRRVHDVNVIGTYLCIREAAKRMRPGSRICTVASIAGKRGGGLSGTAAYAASKGAVLALTRNAARSLAASGIAVNCVAPGATMTAMLDGPFAVPGQRERVAATSVLDRVGEAAEIAEAIAWLLSPKSSFVHGETLTVDGGVMMD